MLPKLRTNTGWGFEPPSPLRRTAITLYVHSNPSPLRRTAIDMGQPNDGFVAHWKRWVKHATTTNEKRKDNDPLNRVQSPSRHSNWEVVEEGHLCRGGVRTTYSQGRQPTCITRALTSLRLNPRHLPSFTATNSNN